MRHLSLIALTSLGACASTPHGPAGDGGESARAWVAALFEKGATAHYRAHEEQHAVTPAAAERGGPESDKDWVVTPQDGELTCTVADVYMAGDAEVSRVTCEGYLSATLGAPPAGLWVATKLGLYHFSGEYDAPELTVALQADNVPLLPEPVVAGTRQNDSHEIVIERHGDGLCATDTQLMGDDGGTSACLSKAGWPTRFQASGGAAWMYSSIELVLR